MTLLLEQHSVSVIIITTGQNLVPWVKEVKRVVFPAQTRIA